MGTWGTGPFDSDMAEDFVGQLEGLTPERRAEVIRSRLEHAISDRSDKLLGEVLAAAAVVAAGLPSGRGLPWNEDYPGNAAWLPGNDITGLALMADRVLDSHFPSDGWYWRSWVDEDDRAEAILVHERLRQALQDR